MSHHFEDEEEECVIVYQKDLRGLPMLNVCRYAGVPHRTIGEGQYVIQLKNRDSVRAAIMHLRKFVGENN